MSWTSHVYHVVKDFQTLGAAAIAFSAAALTFYSQNRVANRAAQTALDIQQRTIKEQRITNDLKEARFRLAFSIEMGIALGNVGADIKRRAHQARLFTEFAKTDDEGMSLQTAEADIVWKPFLGFPPLIDKFKIFATPLSDLSRLDARTQNYFHILRQICSDVDSAIADSIHMADNQDFVLSAYISNIIDFAAIFESHETSFVEDNTIMKSKLLERQIGDVPVRPS